MASPVSIWTSQIEGKGLFAERDFAPWEVVLTWDTSNTITQTQFNELNEEERRHINKIDGRYIVMQSPEKYVNHSCNPNTQVQWSSDVAIQYISKGEEITSSYVGETVLLCESASACNCGAKNCTGFIVHAPKNETKAQWFTLVELLVVITIIAITSVAAISGFSRLGEAEESRSIAQRVADTIDELDHAVATHKASSYEIVFISGSLGYRIERDYYGRGDRMSIASYDYESGTGVVTSNSASTGSWQIGLWRGDRFQGSSVATASGESMSFAFSGDTSMDRYDLTGVIGESSLNSFSFVYYDGENLGGVDEKQIRLTSISWSTLTYSSLILRNILGKKELYGLGASLDSLTGATLTLEKNGKEVRVEVKK